MSSPAIPTTTWPGTVLAMSSAASSARLHDWITDSRSAIAPPDIAAGACGSAAHAEHLAIRALAPHHQDLDEVCSDVQHREVAVVIAALPEELELGQFDASSCSRRLNASPAGPLSFPRARCFWPPPVPKREARRAASYSEVRSLDTLMTNMSPATTVTTPDFTRSRYRSA